MSSTFAGVSLLGLCGVSISPLLLSVDCCFFFHPFHGLFASDRVRVRKPWPGSPRIKESPNQSPKQQGPSPVDFAPSSPSYQHFPKQVKSPPSARRVPRKKSLRKTKVSIISSFDFGRDTDTQTG